MLNYGHEGQKDALGRLKRYEKIYISFTFLSSGNILIYLD